MSATFPPWSSARFAPGTLAAELIKLIEEDDASLTEADFAGSTIYALKSQVLTEQLCNALKSSTHVRVVDLTDCGLNEKKVQALRRIWRSA